LIPAVTIQYSVTVLFSSDIASRVGAEVATFAVPAHKFLQAIIEYCPSLEAINLVELGKFGKCEIEAVRNSCDVLLYLLNDLH
jgi:hypothetical protein